MDFTQQACPFNEIGAAAVPRVLALNPQVFGMFVRNKNGNLVVMEGIVTGNKLTDVKAYWLDIEPSYRFTARAKGRLHDVDQLNLLDYRAYGWKHNRIDDTTLELTMNQLPKQKVTVKLEASGVNAYTMLNNELCRLQYVYVHDNKAFIPRVEYVELVGINRSRQEVRQRV